MRNPRIPKSRPTFNQKRYEDGEGPWEPRIGDGDELRGESSKWLAGMLNRFPIGDEGRATTGTKRPNTNKCVPKRKHTRTAVLTGRS